MFVPIVNYVPKIPPEAPPPSAGTAPDGYYRIPAFHEYQETGNFFTDMADLPYNKVCRALNTAVDIVNMPVHDVQYIGEHGWRAYGEAALEANINGLKQVGYSLMDTVRSGMDFLREAPKQVMDYIVFNDPGEILADTYTYCKESLTSVGAWDQAIDMALGAVVFKKVGGPSVANEVGVVDDIAVGAASKKAGSYRLDRVLPRDKYGNPIPDVDTPHTQIGTKRGRNGAYTQAREWGYDANGSLVLKRDIDFTDHGRPQNHPNPHQHDWVPNPTGGTLQHGPTKPLEWQ